MNEEAKYIGLLAEIFRTINGEGGQSEAWGMAAKALGINTDDCPGNWEDAFCVIPTSALSGKSLSYAVWLAEHNELPSVCNKTGLIVIDHEIYFDPVNDWSQFADFLSRHRDIKTMFPKYCRDESVSASVLKAYASNVLGQHAEVPLRLL